MARRLILLTGKGGVGKTTLASATALLSARHGHRTLLLSTDPAHSLSDVWARRLSHRPRRMLPNIWGQEVSVHREIERSWSVIQRFVARFLESQGVDEVLADELAVLPGAEELVSLLAIERHLSDDAADVIVVDCAPTASTVRLLGFPEAFHRGVDRLFPRTRRLARALRPLAEGYLRTPLPDEIVFDEIESIDLRLRRLRRQIQDPSISSVRIVLTPQRTVIRESRRIMAVLHLLGLAVDAVLVNQAADGATNGADSEIQRHFAPAPLYRAPAAAREVIGASAIEALGRRIYGEADPAQVLHRDQPMRLRREEGRHVLTMALPVPDDRDLRLERLSEDLVVEVGSFRRSVPLPRPLRGRAIEEATLRGGELYVRFALERKGRS